MKIIFSLILFLSCLKLFSQAYEEIYTPDILRKDLSYLKSKLEDFHPNLYLYTSKSGMDSLFSALMEGITQPMTELEFYSLIAVASSVIKDGHTIFLPSEKATALYNSQAKFLPLQLRLIDNRLYIEKIYSGERGLDAGAEVKGINGMDSDEIIHKISDRLVRDGHNSTYPSWILDHYFREYYSYIFGHSEKFIITSKFEHVILNVELNALSKDSIAFYKKSKYPLPVTDHEAGGITFQTIDDSIGLLTIKSFDNAILKETYQQNFGATIKQLFENIYVNHFKHLILDIRDNQGGDIENSVILLAHLLAKPFRVVEGYQCIKDHKIVECHGPAERMHAPLPTAYKGNLYVLINGGSFSNSGIVSASLQAHGRGVFIGEETGGNPFLIGGMIKNITLPSTGIRVEIPTKRFVINSSQKNNGHGIIPDYEIKANANGELNSTDVVLNFAKQLIRNTQ